MATHKVIFTPGARRDLIHLYEYIADKSDPMRAENYTKRIQECCLSLSTFPVRGKKQDDIRLGLRSVGFGKRATIAFHIDAKIVVIDRILYGGRSLKKALSDNEE